MPSRRSEVDRTATDNTATLFARTATRIGYRPNVMLSVGTISVDQPLLVDLSLSLQGDSNALRARRLQARAFVLQAAILVTSRVTRVPSESRQRQRPGNNAK